jgi:hypothetical protein
MKIDKTSVAIPETFKPVAFTITCETKEEAQAMYAVFNYSPNTELVGSAHADAIKSAIGNHSVRSYETIARGVTYNRFYCNKQAA